MKSGLLFLAFVSASFPLLEAPSLAAAPDRPQVQAQLLDRNEFLCSNCFFGASTYYYCFEADNKVLIGYRKTPTLNWKDESSNDLTRVRKSWASWTPDGKSVPLSYDDKFIWVTGPDGKSVKLKQDYTTDIFVNSKQCRSAVKKKSE